MSLGLLHPELLLLLVPAGLVWWKTRGGSLPTQALRLLIGLSLLLALAAPYLRTAARGRDLVLVVDRSRSMPADAEATALELARLAGEARREGDTLAVISFGGRPRVEQLASETAELERFDADVLEDASDLGAALDLALGLIPDDRPGSILLISDGESNGRDPVPVARRAFARGVRFDVREVRRPQTADLSVERLDLPQEVEAGEPFQFSVWVRADRRVESEFVLERGARQLSSGRRVFEPGLNRLTFRDVLDRPGVAQYEVRLDAGGDRVPENDRGVGALQVQGARRVLLVNDSGQETTLASALRKGGIPVDVATPEMAPLDRISLASYRAVVIENVEASRFQQGLFGLREYVVERGGGLMLTGGRASFGIGGYFKSTIDELLPVSMEMRQEHRKQGIALAIVMDRSGSMGAPVTPTRTKMDLANMGASEAIRLLAPMDAVTVIAVDSSPHVIFPMTDVVDSAGITSKVRQIESGGGGIYVRTGLLAATRELEKAGQLNKHIILFSDAADSEEQEGVPELVQGLRQSNVTLSTIALGTEQDVDAEFLMLITAIGGGQTYFSTDPAELPRLFAQDTMTAARATYVEEPTGGRVLPDLLGLGDIPSRSFPVVDGYNLTYLREGAVAGVVSLDEYEAPLFAFSYQGLGRTAALTAQVGGADGGALVAWEEFSAFAVTSARWLAGQEEPAALFPSVRREGAHAVVAVEVDPDAPSPPDTSHLEARISTADGGTETLVLARTGEHRYEARYPLEHEGIALGTVRLDEDRFVTLPPIALPYSPEFERGADLERGSRLLRRLAQESGGTLDPPASALYEGERSARAWRVISRELVLAALLLFLLEVAGRRLQLWGRWRLPASLLASLSAARGAVSRPGPDRERRGPAPAIGGDAQEAPQPKEPAEPATPAAEGGDDVRQALERARRAAGRRLGR